MALWNSIFLAKDVESALHSLGENAGKACIIGGGTDLLLDLQQGRHPPVDVLVDVTRIPDLTRLEISQNHLFVGAAVPLSRVAKSPDVLQCAQALSEACNLIGGPQVRNVATLGGNVAHALPAADGTIALLACGASAKIASVNGRRTVPLEELFLGPGKSALNSSADLLVGFSLPTGGAESGSAFKRVMRPQGVALPVINMAAWIQREGEHIYEMRLAVGPSGTTPKRVRPVEEFLKGKDFSRIALPDVIEILLASVNFRSSPHRATAQYRYHLSQVLLEDVLTVAWQRTF